MNNFNNENWNFLKKSLLNRNIIPVIGPDALMAELLERPGISIPFYTLIAKDLLTKFQIEPKAEILDHTWALYKAVFLIMANKRGEYNQVRRAIVSLVDSYSELVKPAEILRKLASISYFKKYVSLPPDEVLKNTISSFDNSETVLVSRFSPLDASESINDLPPLQQGVRGIFQILKSCMSLGNGFAIHEEDALEYIYRLQTDWTKV